MTSLAERADRDVLERMTDRDAIERVLAGDTGLFELIMRRYNRRLFRVARSILKSDAEAEDAVQDAYVAAFSRLGQFRGPDGFGSWICRITTNEALMRRRRQAGPQLVPLTDLEQPAHQEAAMIDPRSPADNPEASLHDDQLRRLLEAAVDALPDAYRAAFTLREIEELSVAETADCLGVEAATVKTRVHRARRLLRKNITAEFSAALTGTFAFDGARCDRLVARVFERLNAPGGARPYPTPGESR